jgi:AcrR family transcriptional regulator
MTNNTVGRHGKAYVRGGVGVAGRDGTPEKRREILYAAIRVLARDGIAAATTRKIAAEAGVNQAMLGYYFGGKDELLLAVLEEMMRLTGEIARGALPPGREPRDALAEAVTAFWEHVEQAPELQVMQYELTLYALRNPAAAWLAREQYAGYCRVVTELTREAFTAAGRACAIAPEELARFIVGGLDGMILQFVSDRDTVRARRDLANLIAAAQALADGAANQTEARPAGRRVASEGV